MTGTLCRRTHSATLSAPAKTGSAVSSTLVAGARVPGIALVGADCAEGFDVARELDSSAVEPGTVMAIRSGSNRLYDLRVAGVIIGTEGCYAA